MDFRAMEWERCERPSGIDDVERELEVDAGVYPDANECDGGLAPAHGVGKGGVGFDAPVDDGMGGKRGFATPFNTKRFGKHVVSMSEIYAHREVGYEYYVPETDIQALWRDPAAEVVEVPFEIPLFLPKNKIRRSRCA